MLSLKLALVETDSLALIDAEVLSLNDTLTDLLSETDSLALTDSRQLGRLNSGLDSLVGSPLLQLNELDCCDALVLKLLETLLLSDVDVLTLLLKLSEVLAEVEASPEPLLVLVEAESLPELLLALIEAD